MTANTAPGLELAASVAAIALHDIATELERMAERAAGRTSQPGPLTSPAAAPTQAAE